MFDGAVKQGVIDAGAGVDERDGLVDLGNERDEQGLIGGGQSREDILIRDGVRTAHRPGELFLESLPAAASAFDHGTLRVHRHGGIQNRPGFRASEASMLRFQQGEHLAVLLQLVSKRVN